MLVALLLVSCGGDEQMSSSMETALHGQLDRIRAAAGTDDEAARDAIARFRQIVKEGIATGEITEVRGAELLAALQQVAEAMPPRAEEEVPSEETEEAEPEDGEEEAEEEQKELEEELEEEAEEAEEELREERKKDKEEKRDD